MSVERELYKGGGKKRKDALVITYDFEVKDNTLID